MASTTIVDFYSMGKDENVITLKVSIQQAQIAKSTVMIDKKHLGVFEDSFEVVLGKAKDLMACRLYVNTTETDVDPDADLVSFTLELTGGPTPYKNMRAQTIPSGGFVFYTAELTLLP